MNTPENKFYRRIRSFVRREGKITPGQTRALEKHWPQVGCELQNGLLPKSDKPIVFEIGFGMGDSFVEMARQNPQYQFVGVEVYRPGVGSMLMKMEKAGVNNIKVYRDDAVEVLEQCIADHSLQAVCIFFPDPWHKKRHHKRRLINEKFIKLLLQKLNPQGYLHIATDWQHYAEEIIELMQTFPQLQTLPAEKALTRPSTKYQKRGERLGHGVWDLYYCLY